MKDDKFDFDKIISSNLSTVTNQYQPRQILYTEKEGYVIIKKYDDTKKIYTCKVKTIDDQDEKN